MGQASRYFDEKESIVISLLYLEGELRDLNMTLTGDQIKKTIQTAIHEIKKEACIDSNTETIKDCLERAREQNNDDLVKFLQQMDFYTSLKRKHSRKKM